MNNKINTDYDSTPPSRDGPWRIETKDTWLGGVGGGGPDQDGGHKEKCKDQKTKPKLKKPTGNKTLWKKKTNGTTEEGAAGGGWDQRGGAAADEGPGEVAARGLGLTRVLGLRAEAAAGSEACGIMADFHRDSWRWWGVMANARRDTEVEHHQRHTEAQ